MNLLAMCYGLFLNFNEVWRRHPDIYPSSASTFIFHLLFHRYVLLDWPSKNSPFTSLKATLIENFELLSRVGMKRRLVDEIIPVCEEYYVKFVCARMLISSIKLGDNFALKGAVVSRIPSACISYTVWKTKMKSHNFFFELICTDH